MSKTSSPPQVALTKKAADLKTTSDKKRRQPHWLVRPIPALESETSPTPERLGAAHQSQGPPRLLDKATVLTITGTSFPTIWQWMRDGTFPRSRVVGGRSMWLSTEVEQWLAALPIRKLKGDAPAEAE